MSTPEVSSLKVSKTFHILQPIGSGGMGEVFEAVEPGLGHRLAIKMLRAEHAADPEACKRFTAEAEIMASIEHPGNLPIYGRGVDSAGRPFYATKKVSGRTFEEVLAERGERVTNLAWQRRLLHLFEEACNVVASAHQVGIVHRDLKPNNVLIDEEHGTVYVIDWGIAKRTAAMGADTDTGPTFDGAVMGSPGYLSPEQARGDSATAGPQADVFSLGVILYQILTGKQPFTGETVRESVLKVIHRQPEDPRRHNLWVSRSLAAVCRKAVEKDPNKRYPTARELVDDIRAHREGRPVSIIRRSLLEHFRAWVIQQPAHATLTLTAATVLFSLAVLVGGQVWADQVMARKAFKSLAATDVAIAELDRQIRTLKQSSAERGPDFALERRALEFRRIMRQAEAMCLLLAVNGLRFINTDDDVLAAGRQRVFDAIESGIRDREPEFATVIAATVLERIEQGIAFQEYTSTDIEKLHEYLAEAEAMLAEQSAVKPVTEPAPKP